MTKKKLLTKKKIQLIRKKNFSRTILNLNYETFIIYITIFNISFNIDNNIYPSKKT